MKDPMRGRFEREPEPGPPFWWEKLPRLPRLSGGVAVIGWLIVLGLLIWYGSSGVYQISPQEVGLVKQFGRYVGPPKGPGLNYHLPWPMESVVIINQSQVRKEELGFRTLTPPPNPQYKDVEEEALMLTGDNNIVHTEVVVQYEISDPVKFAFNLNLVGDAETVIRQATESLLREKVAERKIDEVLTTERDTLALEVQQALQELLNSYEIGVKVSKIALQDVRPPTPVKAAFDDVNSARQDRERLINEAERYRNDVIPKAQGVAQELLNQAEAYKQTRQKIAQGDVARFVDILDRYKLGQDVTRVRLYLETMEEILPKLNKLILTKGTSGSTVQYLDLESLLRAAREKK